MAGQAEVKRGTAGIDKDVMAVDGHCHLMKDIAIRRDRGERAVFKKHHLPLLQQGGVKMLLLIIGGDNSSMIRGSDFMLQGTLEMIDTFYEELEESSDAMLLCLNPADIEQALAQDRVAVVLGLEGGRALEGRPMQDSLASLRTFYRLGVRSIQLTGNGRNRLADGVAEARTRGGLSRFGIAVIHEMIRLKMLIDISHLSEAGIIDVLEHAKGPIVASHSNSRMVCDHPRNLSDDVIKKIAETGGIVGLTLFSTLLNKDKDLATVEDLADHIDHIAGLVGIDHVGLGPDFSEFGIRISQWTGGRGNMEGMHYGVKENYFHPELRDWSHFPHITACLLERGYAEKDIGKVLGENFLSLYRNVL